ncbi:NADP-dependent oxidoreductase [Streptomyces sp. NBC_00683]|uniref:NADP-dependent oxidoreductase n=1 Tax=Streptomyces sp. NBC_00683 TaxID=2903670 RepID=UPI002E335A63|nr:NADP-dependent oxidoreductase [Streptomyces sp. NBC_00683]
MRAVVVKRFGGPEAVEVVEASLPEPGPGQVRIKVAAAALNPVDAAYGGGFLVPLPKDGPLGLGWDVAGTVDAVGAGAPFAAGAEVVALAYGPAPAKAQAEYVVVDSTAVAPAPASVDAAHAATVPLNTLTAAQALDLLDLAPGSTLLVTGAAGAVGGYAVQLAHRAGITVAGMAGAADEELVRSLGADRFVERGAAAGPFDAVLDAAVLGADALAYVRDDGDYVGVIPQAGPPGVRGIRVQVVEVAADGNRLAELVKLVDAGVLTPRVARTYPLEEATDAYRRLAEGGVRGRLVLVPRTG